MNYHHWHSLSNEDLACEDVAHLNLRATEGLPGAEGLAAWRFSSRPNRWTFSCGRTF